MESDMTEGACNFARDALSYHNASQKLLDCQSEFRQLTDDRRRAAIRVYCAKLEMENKWLQFTKSLGRFVLIILMHDFTCIT